MIMLTLSSERIFNQMHYTGTKFVSMYFLQTQIQAVPVLSSLYPFRISFSSLTFTCAPYRIFLLFLPCLPCHFYLAVIEQQQHSTGFSFCFFPVFLAIFTLLSSNNSNNIFCSVPHGPQSHHSDPSSNISSFAFF